MAYDQDDISLEELMGRFGFTPPGPKSVFLRLREAMAGHGVISTKYKELLALAVCITSRREDCVTEHARQALRAVSDRVALAVGRDAILHGVSRRCAFAEYLHHNVPERLEKLIHGMRWEPGYVPLVPH